MKRIVKMADTLSLSQRPDDPRRILFAIASLARGGAETQLCYLASHLQSRNWEVHVAYMSIVTSSEQNLDRLHRAGVQIHRLNATSNIDPRIALQLHRLIRSTRPSIVQTWLPMMDIVGGLVALLNRVPWIISERNAEPLNPSSPKGRFRRWLGRSAKAIVANSPAGLELWQADALGESTGYVAIRSVILNALPLEELAQVESRSNFEGLVEPGDALVVYAGRLEKQKNIKNLLLALERVATRPLTKALLFGRGSLRDDVDSFIRTRNLGERIIAMGFSDDLWTWLKAADVFVSVSDYEGMPNVVMETMALGTPVVVSDIGEHREICDASTGYLVDGHAPEAISSAIMDCLDNLAVTAEHVSKARVKASGWSIERAVEHYIDLYYWVSPELATVGRGGREA